MLLFCALSALYKESDETHSKKNKRTGIRGYSRRSSEVSFLVGPATHIRNTFFYDHKIKFFLLLIYE